MPPKQEPRTLSIGKVFLLCLICSILSYTAATVRFERQAPAAPTANSLAYEPAEPSVVAPVSTVQQAETHPTHWTVSRVLEPALLQLENGSKVTLLGVEVPDGSDSNATREALAFLKGAVEGRKVSLEFEPENYLEKASSFAYVYLEDGTLLNAALIKKGYLSCSVGDYRLQRDFSRYESQAKQAKLGVWSDEREPSDPLSDIVTEAQEEETTSPSTTVVTPAQSITTPPPYVSSPQTYSSDSFSTSSERSETPSYYVPPRPTYKPPVAENGSYYGEISERTGRPKTVHVRGYFRRDGTYVRGHYRSSPRR